MDINKTTILVDANINRVTEGLRVVEDFSRFMLQSEELTSEIRSIKHSIWALVSEKYPEIIRSRDTSKDILSAVKESKRTVLSDIPKASFNRVKEGLRVLEELGKIVGEEAGLVFKQMRFKIYDIEKKFYEMEEIKNG